MAKVWLTISWTGNFVASITRIATSVASLSAVNVPCKQISFHTNISINIGVKVASPALIWFASRSHGFVIDHIDVHRLIGPYELGLVFVTAIMRRLQLLPHEVALFVYVSFIDGCGDHLPHDHQTMQPLLCPFYLALEVTPAFRYARR